MSERELTEHQVRVICREEFKRIMDTGFMNTEIARQPNKPKTEEKKPPTQPAKDAAVAIEAEFPEDLQQILTFNVQGDWCIVKPTRFLNPEEYRRTLDITLSIGGEYVSAYRDSHFRIPLKGAGK